MSILSVKKNIFKGSISACLMVLLFLLSSNQAVHTQPSQEYQVKAVFLYNFTQFIEWPESSLPEETTPLVIGILGKDPFGAYLDETLRNEKIKNHPLIVQRFKTMDEITTCHILYINIDEKNQLKSIFEGLKFKNILTVGDAVNFAKNGGMIRFYTENNKTRIRINLSAVKSTDLIISSKLLRLADIVEH